MSLLNPAWLPIGVFVAGGLGSLGRWAVQQGVIWVAGPAMGPLATAFVNVSGALAFGLLMGLSACGQGPAPIWRVMLLSGLLGGWTTFSSWVAETVPEGHLPSLSWLLLNGLLPWALGLLAYWAGYRWMVLKHLAEN